MNRHFLVLGVLSLSTLASALACSGAQPGSPVNPEAPAPAGSVSPTPTPPDDAGTRTPLAPDGSSPTAPPSPTGSQPAAADAAPPVATGTLIAAGSDITLFGLTDDGFAVYTSAGNVRAAPIAGGPEVTVASTVGLDGVRISGSAVFSRTTEMLSRPKLSVWTSAHGSVLLDTNSLPREPVVASPDGTKIAYLTGETSPVLTIRDVNGTNPVSLGSLCTTALAFDANGDLISTNCPAVLGDASDGAAPFASLTIFAAPGYAPSLLATDAAYAMDPSGGWLWALGDDGGGDLVRTSDGAVVFSGASVAGSALFDPNGSTLYYVSGDALESLSVASPASSTTIVPAEVGSLLAISPDGTNLAYDNGLGAFAQSTSAVGPAVMIAGAAPNATFTYTSDSKAVVIVTPKNSGSSYDVRAVGKRESLVSGDGVSSVTVLAGSKVLVVDTSNDGRVVNVALEQPAVDVPQMGAFAVSKDKTKVAYVAEGVTMPGLYVVSASASEAGIVAP